MEISPRTAPSYERLDALCDKGRQIRSEHLRRLVLPIFSGRRVGPRVPRWLRLLRQAFGPARSARP